jgi:penicillin-binding protein 1A
MADGKLWRPQNYGNTYDGPYTLGTALKKSKNLATIHLCEKVGPKRVVEYAKRMGITSHMDPYLSISMGSNGVSMMDIVKAYCIFPNGGIAVEPIAIQMIVDADNKIIEQNEPQKKEVLSAGVAYAMVSMLESVLEPGGTAYSAKLSGVDFPAAGKTGTTNNNTDAWFVGFSPLLCCGVWTGYDEIITISEKSTGSSAALPIWIQVMLTSQKSRPIREVPVPTNEVVLKDICRDSHLLATSRCTDVTKEVFILKNPIPESYCPLSHRGEGKSPTFLRSSTTQSTDQTKPQGSSTTSPKPDREKKKSGL